MRGHISEPRGDDGRGAARRGLRHLRGRQVAPRARWRSASAAGPVRPVAAASAASTASTASSTARPTSSTPSSSTTTTASTRPRTAGGRLPPQRGPRRPGDRVHPRHEVDPARPAVLHLPRVRRDARAAPGAARVPREVPRAGSTTGWDVVRERWFARQMELGLVPAGHRARAAQPGRRAVGRRCPRTSGAWRPACRRRSPRSSTTPTRRSAGSSTSSTRLGQLDNTMIVLLSDNGASQEGGPFGVLHEMKFFNFILETPDEAIDRLDDIGGPHSHTNYPWGWAQAGNTPFKWYKQNTHEGGVHVPLHRALAGAASTTRGGAAPPVPPRHRHRADDLRGRSASTPPDVYRGSSRCRSPARRCVYTLRPPRRRADREAGAVLRDDGPPGDLRRRLEGGDPPPAGHAVRRRPVGALPRRRRPLGVPRPRRRACPTSSPSWSTSGGTRPRRTACCRSTTAPSSCSAPASATARRTRADRRYTYRPPMSSLPGPGRRADRWPQLGPDAADRPAGRATGGVLYATGTENSGRQRVRPGRPAGVRLQRASATTTSSSRTVDGAGRRRRSSACGSAATGRRRRTPPS